jgi:hypothetical protein
MVESKRFGDPHKRPHLLDVLAWAAIFIRMCLRIDTGWPYPMNRLGHVLRTQATG